jgi:hypothetical protein
MMFDYASVLANGFLGAIAWGVRMPTRGVDRGSAAAGHGIIATDPPVALIQKPSGGAVTSHPLTRQQARIRAIRSGIVPTAPELPERLQRLLHHH